MLDLRVRDFINFIDGKLIKGDMDFKICSVSTDTRTIQPSSLFFPLSGEKFDGHKFIPEALARGACGFVTSRQEDFNLQAELIILVHNPLTAYQKFASFWRKQFSIPLIAVTGSNGKTTTKEIISTLLSQNFNNILKSKENFNNEIGVPKTLLELTSGHDCGVLEFAMRGPGEIALLTDIASPEIGVITNIGEAHIGRLGSRREIARAKAELIEGLPSDGLAVINRDNDWFDFLRDKVSCKNIITFGFSKESDIFADNIIEYGIKGTEFDVHFNGKKQRVSFNLLGMHNIYNFLASIAVGKYLIKDLSLDHGDFTSNEGRMKICHNNKGITIIDDTYNSNPLAMKHMVETIVKYFPDKRKIAVIGDMLELGSQEEKAHSETGRLISTSGIEYLITFGPLSRYMVEGASGMKAFSFDDKKEIFHKLQEILMPQDVVLIKGSRGMHMEDIVEFLLKEHK